MGRETRQQRRARERRYGPRDAKRTNWSLILGVTIVVLVAAVFTGQALGLGSGKGQSQTADKSIDGIPCGQETVTYHVHAHLTIFDHGQPASVPTQIGTGVTNCLYWLHTHDASGVIHIEAPSSVFRPTLGKVFDIASYTNGESVLPPLRSGTPMRIFVDQKLYRGRLRDIPLLQHTTITVDIGRPFTPPRKYDFSNL